MQPWLHYSNKIFYALSKIQSTDVILFSSMVASTSLQVINPSKKIYQIVTRMPLTKTKYLWIFEKKDTGSWQS
jgi:hypothetical protein